MEDLNDKDGSLSPTKAKKRTQKGKGDHSGKDASQENSSKLKSL